MPSVLGRMPEVCGEPLTHSQLLTNWAEKVDCLAGTWRLASSFYRSVCSGCFRIQTRSLLEKPVILRQQ